MFILTEEIFSANLLPISEKCLLKVEAISDESFKVILFEIILVGKRNPVGFKVTNSLIPAQVFLMFLLFSRKYVWQ